jgi:hypothetical protein
MVMIVPGQWSFVMGQRRSRMIMAIDSRPTAIDILSESATGQPVRTAMSVLGMTGPGFSTQQLHRYQIALVHPFNFDRDID